MTMKSHGAERSGAADRTAAGKEDRGMAERRRACGRRDGARAECDLCGREIGWDEGYYRVSGENVCRRCLADFAAQILAVYEVKGGEEA